MSASRSQKVRDEYPSILSNEPSAIVLPPLCSRLTREVLVDKIKGVIYGNAIGDAVGLHTEFMSKSQAYSAFGDKGILLDRSARGWDAGDWSDDTDQMILIMDGLLRYAGKVDEKDFARRLHFWVQNGFPELGDTCGAGCGGVVGSAVHAAGFLHDPHAAAQKVFERSRGWAAANGAVMRTSILGVPHFYNIDTVVENTLAISKCTHADPRCSASCVATTVAIALMLQGELYEYDPQRTAEEDAKAIEPLFQRAIEEACKQLDEGDQLEFVSHCSVKSVDELKLDERSKIGYTYKCVGSGMYYLRTGTDFYKCIHELALEAGDADTNGAVAGALLGCKLGYNALPHVWLDALREKSWLDQRVQRFLVLLGLEVMPD